MWVFGGDKAWEEMNAGGDFKIPRIFYYVMKYLTPVVLSVIMIWWLIKDAIPILLLSEMNPENIPYIWTARILMILLFILILYSIKIVWKNNAVNNK
jgi:SNF family Na+-dependent transporter